ncbi:MAG: ABC transporter ATP-binding protein [Bacteroidota bacterium]
MTQATATVATPLLKVSHLHIGFGKAAATKHVVEDLTFELAKGETLGIVGESGSGKSMTALSIMGLLPPGGKITQGEILFQDGEETQDFTQIPEKVYRTYRGKRMGMIFQEPMTSLNPVHRCGEQVAEVLRLHKKLSKQDAKKETLSWFEKVKLPRIEEIYASYPHQLSGGQKQRVMIAMAMCCHPDILIADEPTTALDVTVQEEILRLIIDLQAQFGVAVIFISHDLGVVGSLADRVMVMYQGQMVEQGDVKQIFVNAQHPYTRGLLACRPAMGAQPKRLPVLKDFLSEDKAKETRVESKSIRSEGGEAFIRVEHLKTYFPIRNSVFGKTRGYVKAVDDVSFEIQKGETLGLVGESGCGKTTLGRSILRLEEPTEGKIYLGETDLLSLSNAEMRQARQRIQMIFQDAFSSLNPRMSIGSAVKEPMTVHRIGASEAERKERVITLLEKVGLEADHYHRYPHQFSGGQKQRIGIARALAVNPEFIVCDESVSALDVSVQAQVLNLLKDLQDELNLTYLFISHDFAVINFISDRVFVMNEGKIVEQGRPDQIYQSPQSPYTQTLIQAIPPGSWAEIEKKRKKLGKLQGY